MRVKRHVLAVGIAAAILSGGGVATAGPASATPLSNVHDSVAQGWYYAGNYSTLDKCVAAGRSSGQQWKCIESAKWLLYLKG